MTSGSSLVGALPTNGSVSENDGTPAGAAIEARMTLDFVTGLIRNGNDAMCGVGLHLAEQYFRLRPEVSQTIAERLIDGRRSRPTYTDLGEDTVFRALRLLSSELNDSCVKAVAYCLKHAKPRVRREAAATLVRQKVITEAIVRYIIGQLSDEDAWVLERLCDDVGKLAACTELRIQALLDLEQRARFGNFKGRDSDRVRVSAITALANIIRSNTPLHAQQPAIDLAFTLAESSLNDDVVKAGVAAREACSRSSAS